MEFATIVTSASSSMMAVSAIKGLDVAESFAPDYICDTEDMSIIPDDVRRCGHAVREHAKPYFTLDGQDLVLNNYPVPPPQGQIVRKMDLFRQTFGYSHLADPVMRRVAIHYWLNSRIELVRNSRLDWAQNGPCLAIGCALMERLAALKNK